MSETGDRRPGGLIPPIYFLIGLVLQVTLHHLIPITSVIGPPRRIAGALFVAGGILLAVWGNLVFRRLGTPVRPFEPSTALAQEGPFARTRNPMYLGMVCVLIGTATALGSLMPWFVVPIFIWLISSLFIAHEEAMLEATFGDAYLEYRRRVRRWL